MSPEERKRRRKRNEGARRSLTAPSAERSLTDAERYAERADAALQKAAAREGTKKDRTTCMPGGKTYRRDKLGRKRSHCLGGGRAGSCLRSRARSRKRARTVKELTE